ncbi:DUF4097 family beta strand repeat-containing protein [Bacillus mesophilum]|uniref:DUF4097 domain-containing protein n=1 Tax=Bacillus mesophilum TaxID=1071718 RepID=A0A7V7RHR1_9BACI|nr:DUF4097 family beta strand repeat-containing protein [Bacillus mesophilum]KAB2329157.1 DUF4097 domain-containing protein [Bacillus mesophilum]
MKQSKRPSKRIAIYLIAAGILLACTGAAAGSKFSIINTSEGFKAAGEEDLQQEEWSLEEFNNIDINLNDADIEVLPSTEYKIEIERLESRKVSHYVEDDTLFIEEENARPSFFMMNFAFVSYSTKVKVYVPETLEDIKIDHHFGDLTLGGVESNFILISKEDGDIEIHNIQSKQLAIQNSYGDITGSDLKIDQLDLQLNDGNVKLDSIDAASAAFKNKFGDTTLQDYTSQETYLESTDGDLHIGGELLGDSTITSSYGDIHLSLVNKQAELNYDIENEYGDISINGQEYVDKASNHNDSDHKLTVSSKDGDVEMEVN